MKMHMLRQLMAALAVMFAFLSSYPVMAAGSIGESIDIGTAALSVTESSTDVVMDSSTAIKIAGFNETDKISYNNKEIQNGGTMPDPGYFFLHSVSAVDRSTYTEYVLNAEPICAVYYSVDSKIGMPVETAYYIAGTTIDLPAPAILPSQENARFTGWISKEGSPLTTLTLHEDTTLYAAFSVPGDLRKISSIKVNPFPNSTSLSEIIDSLPKTATLMLDNGTSGQAFIDWAAESEYDPALTTEQTVTFRGSITLPDNITNTTGVETKIKTTVIVYGAEASTYTLTYDPNGGRGDVPAPSSYKAGDRIFLYSAVTKPHSRFLGWSTAPDSSYANAGSSSMTMPSHDVTLYAIYADTDSFEISFDMGKSTTAPPETITVYENELAVLPFDIPIRETSYVFSGWSTAPDAAVPEYTSGSISTISVKEDTILYAVYDTVKDVSVTYDLNGGTGAITADDNIYHAGESVTVRFTMPARENYTFLGWSFQEYAYAADFRTDGSTTFTMPNHDVTLYAVWRSDETYTVSYDLNGGTGECPSDSHKYYTGDSVQVLFSPVPKKHNAVFAGWASSPSAASPAFTKTGESAFKIGTSNVILYAIYEEEPYLMLKYDANGGTNAPVDNTHYYAGNKVKLNFTDLPAYYAHTFLGWAESPDALVPDYSTESITSFTAMPGSSLKILYAVWDTEKPKHITYDLNGIEAERTPVDHTAYYKGDTAFLDFSVVPKDPDYAFTGWAKTKDAYEPYYTNGDKKSLQIASEDIILYAMFERSTDIDGTVKITYSPGQGCLKAIYEPGRKKATALTYTWMSDDKTLTAGPAPAYTPSEPGNYRVLLSDSSGKYTGSIASDSTTLYKVTCSASAELDNPAGIYAKGSLVNARAKITSDNLTFKEWSAEGITLSSSQKKSNPLSFTMGAKDVVLSYSATQLYHIKVSGGAASTYSCAEGTSVSLQASSVSGRTFEKWVVSGNVSLSDVTSPQATFTMPATNVTISAVFKADLSDKSSVEEKGEKNDDSASREPLIYTVLSDGGIQNANIQVIHHEQGPLCEAVFHLARDGFTVYEDYYNITVKDGTPPVYETDQKIRLQINIPSELQKSGRTFRMICVSRFGLPYVYDDLDSSDSTITIETSRFYAYALCYSDDFKPQSEPEPEPAIMISDMHDVSESDTLNNNFNVSAMHSLSESQTLFSDIDCIGYTTTEKSTAIENAVDTIVTFYSM